MPLMDYFHYNLATNGVRAGHKILAKFGIGRWTVEVEVTPSGRSSPWLGPPEDYKITVRITTRSGKKYEQSYIATEHGLRTFEKVLATFKSVAKVTHDIKFKVGNMLVKTKQFFVRTKRI